MSQVFTQSVWPGQSGGGNQKPVGLVMLDGMLTMISEGSLNSHIWEWRIVQPWIEYPDNFEVVASVAHDFTVYTLVRHQMID